MKPKKKDKRHEKLKKNNMIRKIVAICLVVAMVVGFAISPLGTVLNLTKKAEAYGRNGETNINYDYSGPVSKNGWNIYNYSNGDVLAGAAHMFDAITDTFSPAAADGHNTGTTFWLQLDSGGNFLSQYSNPAVDISLYNQTDDLTGTTGVYQAVCNNPGLDVIAIGKSPEQFRMGLSTNQYRIGYKATLSKSGVNYTWTVIVGWYECKHKNSAGNWIVDKDAVLITKNLPFGYTYGGVQSAIFTVKYSAIKFNAYKNFQEIYGKKSYYALPWLYTESGAKYELQLSNGTKLADGTTDKRGRIKWSGLTTAATDRYIKLNTDTLYLEFPKQNNGANWDIKLVEVTPPQGYNKKTYAQTAKFHSDLTLTFLMYDGNSSNGSDTDYQKSPLYDYAKKTRIRLAKTAGSYTMSDFNGAKFELYYTPYNVTNLTSGTTITKNESAGTRTVTIKKTAASGNPSAQGDGYYYDDIIYKLGTFEIKDGKITATADTVYWHYTTSANKTAQNNAASGGGTISQNVAISTYSHGAYMSTEGTKTTARTSAIPFKATVSATNAGEQYFTNLPLGKFMLVEVKAPTKKGIDLSTEEYYTWVNSYANSEWNNHTNDDCFIEHVFSVVEKYSFSFTTSKQFDKLGNTDAYNTFSANGIYKRKGGKFQIRKNNADGDILATGTTDDNGVIIWKLESAGTDLGLKLDKTNVNNDTIRNVTKGTKFYIEETESPYGYEKAEPQTVTINADASAAFNESPEEVEISLTKLVEGKTEAECEQSLANGDYNGAKIEVYWTPYSSYNLTHGITIAQPNEAERTVTIKDTTSDNENQSGYGMVYSDIIKKVGTFEIQNGKIVATATNMSLTSTSYKATVDNSTAHGKFTALPLGKYIFIETKAPDSGIKLSTKKYYIHEYLDNATTRMAGYENSTITKDDEDFVQWFVVDDDIEDVVIITEGELDKSVSLSLSKEAENEDCAVGSVKGSEYAILYSENSFTKSKVTITENGTLERTIAIPDGSGIRRVGTFTVNADGVGIVSQVNWETSDHVDKAVTGIATFYGKEGYYQIIEVKAPKNYKFDNKAHNKVYHLTADDEQNFSITSKEPSPTDPFEITISKKPENLEALAEWEKKNGQPFDLSAIKELNDTEFTVNFYKGYSAWASSTNSLRDGIKNGTIQPDISLVYKVIDGKIEFADDTYLKSVLVGTPIYGEDEWKGKIVFPVGMLTIAETKAREGYSVKNSKWTDEQGNEYPAGSTQSFANGVGLVVRISQDPSDVDHCKREIMTGGTPPYVDANTIATTVSGKPNFEVINPTDEAEFNIIKTVEGNLQGVEISGEALADVEFTGYYFYDVAEELKALDSDDDGESDWAEFVAALQSGDEASYQSVLDRYEAKFSIVTDEDGKYNSGSVPTGAYVIIEEECEANRGLALANPIVIELAKGDEATEEVTNYIPEIHTTEWDKELSDDSDEGHKTHMSNADSSVTVMDTIAYTNLRPNTTYTFKAIIMDVTNGTPTILRKGDGNSIQKRVTFTTPADTIGIEHTVDMEFAPFSALDLKDENGQPITASGRKFVIYEFLFEGDQTSKSLTGSDITKLINNQDDVSKAVRTKNGYVGHWDAEDDSQIGWFPTFSTTEKDSATLNHVSPIWSGEGFAEGEWINIEDTLTYTLLDKDMTYTVFLEVKDYVTDTVIASKVQPLVPDASGNGSITLDELWLNLANLDDMDKFYICETICKGTITAEEITAENTVGVHDAKVESQTGYVATIGTTAGSSSANGQTNASGIIEAYAAKNVTLTDTVHAHNMMGLTVTITCTYKYVTGSKAGQTVYDADGNALTKTITHTFGNNADEDVPVEITGLNLTNLVDVTMVAYETISYKNSNNEDVVLAKEHKDDSLTQSLAIVGTPVDFNKVDQNGNAVKGATLDLRKESATGTSLGKWTTDGAVKTVTLADGTYCLVETEAPKGYSVAEPIVFEVSGGKIIVDGRELTSLTITMVDLNLTSLPTAGGKGTLPFAITGFAMMLGLPVYSIIKKKKRMI